MAKKRKLNSTNPKYWKKDTTENKPIIERKLIANKGKKTNCKERKDKSICYI